MFIRIMNVCDTSFYVTHPCAKYGKPMSNQKQDAHGSNHSTEKPVQNNKYIWAKLWLKCMVLHLDTLIYPSSKDDLCTDWLKLAQCFWWRRFFKNVKFSPIRNYLPLKIGGTLHLNTLESLLLKNALCQVWLKLAQWIWSRRFLKFVNVFSLIHYYLPLKIGGALHLNKLESSSSKDALY